MEIIDDLLEKEFDFPMKAIIYNNMEVALRAYSKLVSENQNLFKFEKSITAKGYLKTLFVEKQFNEHSFSPKAQYSAYLKEVNKYHHKVLFIETEEFTINIARTRKSYMLPGKSRYRKEYAKNNTILNTQYEFALDESVKVNDNIMLPKKYAFLTYGVHNDVLEHLEIIVPSHDYKGLLGYLDLSKEAVLLKNYVPEEVKEESVVSLKNEIAKEHNITESGK